MTRDNIIYALAAYAHPSWYHDLLSWSTDQLGRLLDYYKNPDAYHGTTVTVTSLTPHWSDVTITLDECPICRGEGVITCDEFDRDSGQYMAGVGTMRCQCTLEE